MAVLYLSQHCHNCRRLMQELKRTGNTTYSHVVLVDGKSRRELPQVVTGVPMAIMPNGVVLAGTALFEEVARFEAQAEFEPDGVGADGFGALLGNVPDPAEDATAHLDLYFATSDSKAPLGSHGDAREDHSINLDALQAKRMADVQDLLDRQPQQLRC